MSSESAFFYDSDKEVARARQVLEALRLYQAADSAMRRRTRQAMSMRENEMLVLSFLMRAREEGETVTPTDIARYLGISTASTTALIDRLEKSGHLARTRHPTDRRSVLLAATAQADDEMRSALDELDERMLSTASGITESQSRTIVSFLERMRRAVDDVGEPHPMHGGNHGSRHGSPSLAD
ncbi:MarR family winged helix-turn-helix transcriptional regulator [Microbacterium sp. Root61]|uniref:MarR family winged helix-turn-helix transcriptional regulator n=1 Tax=Microbacterium sp. Root61 TaxID=1736570 RepID=UPI0009E6DDD4|nr:MarR family transcriptional regulator [Microbacterium sp. Root61]